MLALKNTILGNLVIGACTCLSLLRTSQAQDAVKLQHRWEVEPKLGGFWVADEVERPAIIDVEQLKSPLRENRVYEAQRIALMQADPNLKNADAALPVLLEALNGNDRNRQLILAMTSAAVALSGGKEASEIWKAVEEEPLARLVVEAKLADWRSDLALDLWRQRIADPSSPTREMLIALEGLAEVGSTSDGPAIEAVLTSDWAPPAIKLAAARAYGKLVSAGNESLAEMLLESPMPFKQLLAAHVLATHTSESSLSLLEQILDGSADPAQAVALAAIVATRPKVGLEKSKTLLSHPDSNVRLLAVQTLGASDAEEDVKAQAYSLRDRTPQIRRLVRARLRNFALAERNPTYVNDVIQYYLRGDSFEGAEQAIVLCVELQKREFCREIVPLLAHPKPQVSVRAGWAIQELADSEEILAEAMPYAQETTQRLVNKIRVEKEEMNRTAFLFQAFGRNRYQPASEMLKLYIPKNNHSMLVTTRTAAIWSLGHLYADSQDEQLAEELAERLLDNTPNDPEDGPVKYASAIAIGMIKCPTSPGYLGRSPEFPPSPIAYATDWALEQINGQ